MQISGSNPKLPVLVVYQRRPFTGKRGRGSEGLSVRIPSRGPISRATDSGQPFAAVARPRRCDASASTPQKQKSTSNALTGIRYRL